MGMKRCIMRKIDRWAVIKAKHVLSNPSIQSSLDGYVFCLYRDYDAKLLGPVLGQAETTNYLMQPIRVLKQG